MANIFEQYGLLRKKRPLTITANADNKILIIADAMEEFSLEQGLNITEHPVEKGVSISDHAQIKLKKTSLRFMITEAPLTIYGLDTSKSGSASLTSIGLGALASSIGGIAGAVVVGVGSKVTDTLLGVGQGRITKAKSILEAMINEKQVVSLTVKNHSVKNLMIESISYPDNSSQGYSLIVDAVFKEIRTVETVVQEKNIKDGANKKSGTKRVSKGLKQGQQPNAEQAAKARERYIQL